MAARPLRLVISHVPPDRALRDAIRRRLMRRKGTDVVEDLHSADVILLLLSQAYLESGPAREEMQLALDRHREGDALAIGVRVDAEAPELRSDVPIRPKSGALGEWRRQKDALVRLDSELWPLIEGRAERLPPVALSRTVQDALDDMRAPTTAGAIVLAILAKHPEYGGDTARHVTVDDRGAESRTGFDWVAEVRGLFRPDAVPLLDGRWMIRGLALLDGELTKGLLQHGFLGQLDAELDRPLVTALTSRGRSQWQPGEVPPLADRPAERDLLRREQFAKGLAQMINEQRDRSERGKACGESFLVHLHGPWGAGKTTLLGFVGDELQRMRPPWIVVQFNAWQQERLEAPWWSLLTTVHRSARSQLGRSGNLWRWARLRALDLLWRMRVGWMAYLLLPMVLGLLWYGWDTGFFDTAKEDRDALTKAGDIAKAAAAILGLVVALLGAASALSRLVAAGPAGGADAFLQTSKDPMRALQRRYKRIVRAAGRPVVVFVDDLDRCQASYVVEVLQGIQTLLIDEPVTYVVAADRRWLYDSFGKVYADFESLGREPGRPLGHVFLEKTFQVSAALPAMASDIHADFWRGLLSPDGAGSAGGRDELVAKAAERVEGAGLDAALAVAKKSDELSPVAGQATREAVARRVASPEVQKEVEHRLVRFAPLLESNPRAMKRLLNAYRLELGRVLTEGGPALSKVTPEQLALWTILSMRWPLLADELAAHPDWVSEDGKIEKTTDDLAAKETTDDLAPLYESESVKDVVAGAGVHALLTGSVVRALGGHDRPRQPV